MRNWKKIREEKKKIQKQIEQSIQKEVLETNLRLVESGKALNLPLAALGYRLKRKIYKKPLFINKRICPYCYKGFVVTKNNKIYCSLKCFKNYMKKRYFKEKEVKEARRRSSRKYYKKIKYYKLCL